MIGYKLEAENENIVIKLNEHDDKELSYSFVESLYGFCQNFNLAIEQESLELLSSLVEESIKIAENKNSNELPSFCFDAQIAKSFIKSFQNEYYKTLFKYSIQIFQNIYISNYCADIENFIPTQLLLHLWDCISFADNYDIHLIIQIIKEIMGKSDKSWSYFNNIIRNESFLAKTSGKVDDPEYIDLLKEYVYFLTKKNRRIINETESNLCYYIILDLFRRFADTYEEHDGKTTEISEYELRKDTILKLIQSFGQIVSIDKIFFVRKRFKKITDLFITNKFLCINDFDIYCCTVRILSQLCDIKYKPISDSYSDRKVHIEFHILENDEVDIFTKLLNDLKDLISIPFDSPNRDIPGHLCNIITTFSKQINDRNINQEALYERKIYFSYSYHQLLACQSIYSIVHVLENRDIISKTKACKTASFILDGPLTLVIQMLNLKVIPIIAVFLESDDIPLIVISLKFYWKLAFSFGKRKIEYPVKSDIEECCLVDLLDGIITVDDEEKRYEKISPQAEQVKALILENIFKIKNGPT